MPYSRLLLVVVAALVLAKDAEAVDRSKFKTCEQNPFCKRNRERTPAEEQFAYRVDPSSLEFTGSRITADLSATDTGLPKLVLHLMLYEQGIARFKVTEKVLEQKRFEIPSDIMRSTLVEQPKIAIKERSSDGLTIDLSAGASLVLQFSPFSIALRHGDKVVLRANSDALLNFETRKVGAGDMTQSFGGHTDSTPHGHSSVGLDFVFEGAQHVYGIPSHATSLALKPTKGADVKSDPYRLFNLDVFEYELDNEMALYGSIPFMTAHQPGSTVGIYWANAAEMWVDVVPDTAGTKTHWFAESGIVDVYLMSGPSPVAVQQQYAKITGPSALPPLFALGYHQCRWNYKDEEDVAAVDAGFEEHNLPYDVIWLDIEHTDGKKYFTWHQELFPTPSNMIDNVAKRKRKMVTIVDPHIKREPGYFVHDEAQAAGHYIKNKDRNTYEGHCWPGSVSYLDFINPTVRKFWAGKFAFDQYKGSTADLFTWNDMNEPSVFNGPETTMQKDCIHNDGQDEYEHRDVHNLYGMLQQMATAAGQVDRTGGKNRPFVLSRAFFAGSQNYGAIWTGDNKADWSHLAASTPMLLSQGVAGLPFSGADVGGFFGNPDTELLVRWYQAGAWQPFFRGHAHIETKRREPWLFGEDNTKIIQAALRLRYQHLPLWYTLFHQAAIDNTPMMQPLWFQWPEQQDLFAVDDQFMVGDAIMVKPVVSAGTTSVSVQLPGTDPWYDGHTHVQITPGVHNAPASLAVVPFFHRGGSIVPRRDRPRRNSALMVKDPFTLVVALNSQQEAKGQLYLDDGQTFEWQTGAFLWRDFSFANSQLKSSAHNAEASGNFINDCVVERLIVLGLAPGELKKVVARVGGADPVELEWLQQPGTSKVVIRKPELPIASDWSISFER